MTEKRGDGNTLLCLQKFHNASVRRLLNYKGRLGERGK